MTLLSICIPTRNRQIYAMSAVRAMVGSPRRDFEIVLADNSDDAAPLADFVADLADPRVKLLSPGPAVLSMRANWERIVDQTSGEWLTYIGDDDYLDPELAELITVVTGRVPLVDAISWGRLHFIWPEARPHREITKVPTGSHLIGVDKQEMMRKLFFWEDATDRPQCPFGVYHGAVRRSLMTEIRDTFGGAYFGHPIVDYDNICRTLMLARALVHFERPVSVFGACMQSNTIGLRDAAIAAERIRTFKAEMDGVIEARGFPFPIELGIAAQIGHVIECFKQQQGIEITAWEENFIRACAHDCEAQPNRERFEERKTGYAGAIAEWRGEAALGAFKPIYKIRHDLPQFIGVNNRTLSFDMGIGGAQSAAEFYAILDTMLFPIHLVESRLAA
ncbi:glycosyl transferase family 2 [Hoeflea marina]|uniref:Glycosyl transferase family 2 n=1 Tax=Hoeflea marina TaxID=274592 RepID=A0A317PI79_9HYPH|nr:glycosyltransferase [Hoeflea marina]PWW00319.1 glycosyl transferase family 2 [Hoeflea marina]